MDEMNVPLMEPDVSKGNSNRKFIKIIFGIMALMVALLVAVIVLFRASVGIYYLPSEAMVPTLMVNDHVTTSKFAYLGNEPAWGDLIVFDAPEAAMGKKGMRFVKRVMGVPGDRIRITGRYVLINNTRYDSDMLRDLAGSGKYDERVQFNKEAILVAGRELTNKELLEALGEPLDARVKIVPGVVYRNGKALIEPYTWEDPDHDYPNVSTPSKFIITDKDGNRELKVPEGKLFMMGDNRNNSNDSRMWGLLDRKSVLGKVTAIISPENRAGPVK